jgi:hypothetical protein
VESHESVPGDRECESWSGRPPVAYSGEPGYKASADYVAQVMQQAGYDVTIQTYKFFYFAFAGTPAFSEISPTAHDFTLSTEWNAFDSIGTVTADVQPAGGIIVPPTPTPSSASGCTAADFSGFVPGRIALIQRGTCNFGVKAQNAEAAGAAGVIIFNEGNPGRTGLAGGGALSDADGNASRRTSPSRSCRSPRAPACSTHTTRRCRAGLRSRARSSTSRVSSIRTPTITT